MTLDDLLADFEAKRDAVCPSLHWWHYSPNALTPDIMVAVYEEYCRHPPLRSFGMDINSSDVIAAYNAAKVYLIARDENMNAAMLWKLQNQ